MQRIAVIGCGGAGKTVLANALGEQLGLPVIHIDSHYWRVVDGERIESTPEQWRACHGGLVAGDAWVIDGMKLGVLDARLVRADAVIFLDLPTRTCLAGIAARRLRYRGRLDPERGVYDRINRPFLAWVWTFRRRQRPRLLQRLADFDGDVVVLTSRRATTRYLASLPTPASH
jgi:adenylate kinase family enzyme